jgi:hypothetical protein
MNLWLLLKVADQMNHHQLLNDCSELGQIRGWKGQNPKHTFQEQPVLLYYHFTSYELQVI